MSVKFVFVTKKYWPGVVNYNRNIAHLLKSLYQDTEIGIYEIAPNESISIAKRLKSDPPNFLFIGGWDQEMQFIAYNTNKRITKIFVGWCSPITQIDLGAEIPQFCGVIDLLRSGVIDKVGLLLENEVSKMQNISTNFIHAPVYLDTSNIGQVSTNHIVMEDKIRCDLFCAPNPRKNLMTQMVALSNYPDIAVHLNYDTRNIYALAAKKIMSRNRVTNHTWQDRNEYLSKIRSMSFAMQVSLSEGMNYTAMEHLMMGIPVICSAAQPYAIHPDIEPLVVHRPEMITEVCDKIQMILDDRFRADMSQKVKKVFNDVNNDMRNKLASTIKEVFFA